MTDNGHCKDHTNCMLSITKNVTSIKNDIKWIMRIVVFVGFTITSGIAILGVYKSSHKAEAKEVCTNGLWQEKEKTGKVR